MVNADTNDPMTRQGLERFRSALQHASHGAPTTDAEARVIQEARARNEHERNTYWCYHDEFLRLLRLDTLAELETIQPLLVRLRFPTIVARPDVRTKQPVARVERRGYQGLEQWLEDIDAIAQRLGYVKAAPSVDRAAMATRAAGAATVVALMAFGFLG